MKPKNTSSKIFASMNQTNKSFSNTSHNHSMEKKLINRTRVEDMDQNTSMKIQTNLSRLKERPMSKIRNIKDSRTMSFDMSNSLILSKSYLHTQGSRDIRRPDSVDKKLKDNYVSTKEDIKSSKILIEDNQHHSIKPITRSSIVSMENPINKFQEYNPNAASFKTVNSNSTFSRYLSSSNVKQVKDNHDNNNLKSKDTINSSLFMGQNNNSNNVGKLMTCKIIQNNKSKIIHKLTPKTNFPSNSSLLKNNSGASVLTEKPSAGSFHLTLSKHRLHAESTKEDTGSHISDVDKKLNVILS
jgi:hypothetical protein